MHKNDQKQKPMITVPLIEEHRLLIYDYDLFGRAIAAQILDEAVTVVGEQGVKERLEFAGRIELRPVTITVQLESGPTEVQIGLELCFIISGRAHCIRIR